MSCIAEEINSVMNNDDLNLSPGLPSQFTGTGTTGWPSNATVLQYVAMSLAP